MCKVCMSLFLNKMLLEFNWNFSYSFMILDEIYVPQINKSCFVTPRVESVSLCGTVRRDNVRHGVGIKKKESKITVRNRFQKIRNCTALLNTS